MERTQYVDILFGPYEPDWGGLPRPEAPGYLVDALNVRLTPNGYRGLPQFADVGSASTVTASAYTNANGAGFHLENVNSFHFLVTASDLKVLENRSTGVGTWQDVTPASGTLDAVGDWVLFDDLAIYVCEGRAPIAKDTGTTHATLFTDLAGSPPTGGCAARVRDHLVIGRISGGANQCLVRTSAIGNPEDWPTPGTADARSKQSISQSLNSEHGAVHRILGGEKFGVIVQQRALTRMTYVGGSAVFEFDTFHIGAGGDALLLNAQPISDGQRWYWYNGQDGMYVTDGYSVENMSAGRIRESLFLNNLSHPNGTSLTSWIYGAYDHRRRLVIFGRPTGATYNLVYAVETDSLSLMQHTDMSAMYDGYDTSANPTGRAVFNVNGSTKKLQKLGAAGTPTIAMQTGYMEIDPGYNTQIQGAHLLGTGTGSLTLAVKTAATSSACDVSQSGFTSLTAASLGQKKTARATAQYYAFRVTGTGGESQLIRGIRVYYTRSQPAT